MTSGRVKEMNLPRISLSLCSSIASITEDRCVFYDVVRFAFEAIKNEGDEQGMKFTEKTEKRRSSRDGPRRIPPVIVVLSTNEGTR